MRHYLYAVVEDPSNAAHVLHALATDGTDRERCEMLLHTHQLRNEELPAGETQLRLGVVVMAALGGLLGAGLGLLVLVPLGLAGAGVGLTTAFTGTLGLLLGGLFGIIAGAGSPDRALVRLSRELRDGKVLLSIETPDLESMRRAEATLETAGVRVIERPRL